MLALSRKKGEALIINNNIEITVLEIKGEQVKLGIAAPREVPVYRKEVYIQICCLNRNARRGRMGSTPPAGCTVEKR